MLLDLLLKLLLKVDLLDFVQVIKPILFLCKVLNHFLIFGSEIFPNLILLLLLHQLLVLVPLDLQHFFKVFVQVCVGLNVLLHHFVKLLLVLRQDGRSTQSALKRCRARCHFWVVRRVIFLLSRHCINLHLQSSLQLI